MSAFTPPDIAAPVARKVPTSRSYHGREISDDYAWLRDAGYPKVENAEILAHLEAENAYAEAALKPHAPLIETLFQEMKGRLKEDDASVPFRDGAWEYGWRFETGAQYRQWRRRPVKGGDWAVILDEPSLAKGHEYFRMGGFSVAPDGAWLGWSSDTDGSERFALRLKNLVTGEAAAETIPNMSGPPVWTALPGVFLYMELSPEWRPFRVRAHTLGTDPADDPILFEETDTSYFVHLSKTQSREWIVISGGDHVTTEARLLRADAPFEPPILVSEREPGVEMSIDHAGGTFFILTNDTHQNFRVVTASVEAPQREHWQELVAGSDSHYLRDVDAFRDFLVIQERVDGLDHIRLCDHDGGNTRRIDFPEASYVAWLGPNREFAPDRLRIGYQSMVTPMTDYDYDLAKGRLEVLKVQEIPSGYDASQYVTERLIVPARDGASVPVSLVRHRDTPAGAPLHLYAYGAYGMGMPPHFSTERISLLDRGIAYAIAHIRGGDELGRHWYEAGKGEQRENTFNDFIDVAENLVAQGIATKGDISISGRSAGGQLMGVVHNQAPDLWRAVVAAVPFVDALNTMLDDTLPLTPIEWPEWGNPIEDMAAFDLIRRYSPYDNVSAQAYPALFVRAGLNDPRVTYWEPAKWVAKLRDIRTNDAPLLFRTNMGAGHGGKSGRFEHLRETAEEFAFLTVMHGVAGRS